MCRFDNISQESAMRPSENAPSRRAFSDGLICYNRFPLIFICRQEANMSLNSLPVLETRHLGR